MLVLINITYKEVKFRNTKNFQNEPVKGPSKQGSMDDVLILFLLFEVCPTLQKSLQHNYIFQYKTQNKIPDKAQTNTLKCKAPILSIWSWGRAEWTAMGQPSSALTNTNKLWNNKILDIAISYNL